MNYEQRFDEVLEKIEQARIMTNEHQIVKIVAGVIASPLMATGSPFL